MTAVRLAKSVQRGPKVHFRADGSWVEAHAGETLAAALMASGVMRLRLSPRDGAPRGAFCFMGLCQECVVHVDGFPQQACLIQVADGLSVELKGTRG